MNQIIVTIFVLGYIAIATEHLIKINKAAVALLTGVLCWVILISGRLFLAYSSSACAARICPHPVFIEITKIFFIIDISTAAVSLASLLGEFAQKRLFFFIHAPRIVLRHVIKNRATRVFPFLDNNFVY